MPERLESTDRTTEHEADQKQERSVETGAMLGAVSVGPLGAPVGAAIGAAADALLPDADAPVSHTHAEDVPCYDGCPGWVSTKNA